MTEPLAFIIATKDRPDDLRRTLASIAVQSCRPVQIIVVDGSDESVEAVVTEVQHQTGLPLDYLRHLPPSAAAQRNAGIGLLRPGVTLAGFLDDDIEFESDAIERMVAFWRNVGPDVGGAAFNMKNPISTPRGWPKRSRMSEWLGIYGREDGSVMASGWQTVFGTLKETKFVHWLPSGAVLWRRQVLDEVKFDEYYNGYSYCEDLDFSYTAGKQWRLAVVGDALYHHYPSSSGRVSSYTFGRIEVRNRLHFVRKHRLSVGRFYAAMLIRMSLTIGSFLKSRDPARLQRAWGNLLELVKSLVRFSPRPVPAKANRAG